MPFKIIKSYRNLSLQNIITLPFILQIFITVGLVGYLSWRNGERTVDKITSQLRDEVTARVEHHLENYLVTPQLIVELKQKNVKLQQLNPNNFPIVQQDFWSTIQLFDSVRAIFIGNEAGKFIYLQQKEDQLYAKEVTQLAQRKSYSLDNLGQRQKLVEIDQYEPRERPWYIKTQQTKNNNWSQIYTFAGGELGITASGLLQDSQGNTQGIVGVDLILSGIGDFLRNLEISENGQIFILERNGFLVATSSEEAPFVYDQTQQKERRLKAINSKNPLTKATSQYIIKHYSSLYNIDNSEQLDFKLNRERQLVQVLPYQDQLGLDWLIVMAIPEADFMVDINTTTCYTIWLSLIALLIATFLGIYTSRRIAQPLANLSQVTNLIAQSAKAKKTGTDFYPVVKAKSIKELKVLAYSFNEMVVQLKTAFKNLENANEELENRVKQRTKALMSAKEAADASNNAKSEFLANMSHELRTPLHAILGFTQVALQDSALKPQQKKNLVTVKNSGEHLLALINDILEMSKIESGSISVKEKPFDLHLLLENLTKTFQLRLASPPCKSQQKNIELILDLLSNVPQYIQSDPVKLNQILINLVESSIRFTNQGQVEIKVESIEDRSLSGQPSKTSNLRIISFTVEGTGGGILPSEIESIFIPFTQTQQVSANNGIGLGLPISQQFVRLLGGEIEVSSVMGEGSKFSFEIPITIVDRAQVLANSTPPKKPIAANQTTNQVAHGQDLVVAQPQAINLATIASMQSAWLIKLHQAAIEVDAEAIVQLIEQIPARHNFFASELTRMVENFEYDEIIELAQAELNRRKIVNGNQVN